MRIFWFSSINICFNFAHLWRKLKKINKLSSSLSKSGRNTIWKKFSWRKWLEISKMCSDMSLWRKWRMWKNTTSRALTDSEESTRKSTSLGLGIFNFNIFVYYKINIKLRPPTTLSSKSRPCWTLTTKESDRYRPSSSPEITFWLRAGSKGVPWLPLAKSSVSGHKSNRTLKSSVPLMGRSVSFLYLQTCWEASWKTALKSHRTGGPTLYSTSPSS